MGEKEAKKVETPAALEPAPPPPVATVSEKKTATPPSEDKVDDSKALAVVEKAPDSKEEKHPKEEKHSKGSADRDIVLARVEKEKTLSLIKAWEESEKAKAGNKADKKLSAIGSWENSKKASVEAQLRKVEVYHSHNSSYVQKIEEQYEKKKAGYAEKMKNKIAQVHKEAEEKRAMVEAKRGEDLLKAEEMAAKYRAKGIAPKKLLGCF